MGELEDKPVDITDCAKRAYGLLWRDPAPSQWAIEARRILFNFLVKDERREGIAWVQKAHGAMTTNELIAADIRAGAFPQKSS